MVSLVKSISKQKKNVLALALGFFCFFFQNCAPSELLSDSTEFTESEATSDLVDAEQEKLSANSDLRDDAVEPAAFSSAQSLSKGQFCRRSAAVNILRFARQSQPREMMATNVATPIRYRPGFVDEAGLWRYRLRFFANSVLFTPTGRPLIRDQSLHVQYLSNTGVWNKVDLRTVMRGYANSLGKSWTLAMDRGIMQGPQVDERIVMDRNCILYTVINATRAPGLNDLFLLTSTDEGLNWQVLPLGIKNALKTARIEAPAQGRLLARPPVLVIHNLYDPALYGGPRNSERRQWLLIPENVGGQIRITKRLLISAISIAGSTTHSGSGNLAVSVGDNVNMVYPIATTKWHGVEFKSTVFLGRVYNRRTQRLSGEFFVGQSQLYYPSKAGRYDDHDQPSLEADNRGLIHLILNSHNGPMSYHLSKAGGSILGGFRPATIFGKEMPVPGGYSYGVLAIDSKNDVHIIARAIGHDTVYRLVHLRKRSGFTRFEAFENEIGGHVLVDPGRRRYSVYQHKVSVDPWGRVWVAYNYMPDQMVRQEAASWSARHRQHIAVSLGANRRPVCFIDSRVQRCAYSGVKPTRPRMLLLEPGKAWKLGVTQDFY